MGHVSRIHLRDRYVFLLDLATALEPLGSHNHPIDGTRAYR